MELTVGMLMEELKLPPDTKVFALGCHPGSHILFAVFEREQRCLVADMQCISSDRPDEIHIALRIPWKEEDGEISCTQEYPLKNSSTLPPIQSKWWTNTGRLKMLWGHDLGRNDWSWNKPYANFIQSLREQLIERDG